MTTAMVVNASRIVTVDLLDEITVTVDPILATTIGIDVIIAATIVMMTDVMTTIETTASTSVIEVIIVTIATMIVTTIDAMIDVAKMTTIARTTTERSRPLHRRPKGATPMVHSRKPTARSTSSSEVAKRSKATDGLDQTPGRSGTSTLKTRDLYGGLSSQSLSQERSLGPHP
jgi:hypothetical protein